MDAHTEPESADLDPTPAAEPEESVSPEAGKEVEPAPDTPSGSGAPSEASEGGGFPLKQVVEAILFSSQKAVSFKEVQSFTRGAADACPDQPAVVAWRKCKEAEIRSAVEELNAEYEASGRAFVISESAVGYQLVSRPEFAPWLRQLFPENRPQRLSAPAMETLAIIAYRQPITKADVEAVRGVAVDGVMQTLTDKGLIKIAGRADVPGRPLLYETTAHFMEHFGLRNLEELPNASELRKIALPTAPQPEPEAPGQESSPQPEAEVVAGTPAGEEETPSDNAQTA